MLIGTDESGNVIGGGDSAGLRTWIVVERVSGRLRSPFRATFGGFFSRSPECLAADMEAILEDLSARYRGTELTVCLPPTSAPFDVMTQVGILTRRGAELEFTDKNYHVDLDVWSAASMSKGNRKKLRQWNELEGSVRQACRGELEDVYEVVRANRESLGVKPSVTREDLRRLMDTFPGSYDLYLGEVSGQIAASAVVVAVAQRTNYVFYWADSAAFRHLSPVVALHVHLVQTYRALGKTVLDLGIATEAGVDNAGLIRFKKGLGAIDSPKFTFRLTL